MDDFFGTYGEAETDAVVEVVRKAIKRKPEGQEAESHPVKRPCPNEAAEAVAQEAAQFIQQFAEAYTESVFTWETVEKEKVEKLSNEGAMFSTVLRMV